MPALAKNSGASQRKTRTPSGSTASGSARRLCHSPVEPDPAEDLPRRPPAALEEQQDRERDGDHDPGQHTEEHDTGGRRQRQGQRARPGAGEADERRDVGQRDRRRDHDRGERRLGQIGEERAEEQEQERDARRADQAGQLALGARLLGDRRPGAAGGHGEALEHPRGQVRRPEADHLLVRVDLVATAGGEAGRGGDGVGERDERDARRGDQERDHVGGAGPRERRVGQALRERTDGLHCEPERGGDDRGADDRDEDRRDPPADPRAARGAPRASSGRARSSCGPAPRSRARRPGARRRSRRRRSRSRTASAAARRRS